MTTYTLHVPDEVDPAEPEALDSAKLVPDAFVWPAFWFSALWFFWHRLWLAGLLVLAAEILVWLVGLALGLSPAAGFAIALLLSWLVGLEASSLRRWTYARTGRPIRDAVTASDVKEAEVKFVARWLREEGARMGAPPARPVTPAQSRSESPALGLFPEAQGQR
ncbi:DUF2628 domain-containing protein [Methylobacterium indicum]|uniref:DUF2628 domain-containing protein n=1 Tax=Methylobacterium indicum TaxID=1775910 RepID=A0ABR5HCX4_9HYPH|nr:DUF2628 domain-containing protein [Methylobacterium indicum]KMO14454.1 hypothetical protein QR78_23360 [Methylobacterium indicum]KMO23394.1 hypothetical protein QR79_13525 [Methylobacterium indicum]